MIEFEQVNAEINKELAYKFIGGEQLQKSMFFIHIDYNYATCNKGALYHIGGATPAFFMDAVKKCTGVVAYQGLKSGYIYVKTDDEIGDIDADNMIRYTDAVTEAKRLFEVA